MWIKTIILLKTSGDVVHTGSMRRLGWKLNMQSVKCLMVYFCKFLVFLFGLNVKQKCVCARCVCVHVNQDKQVLCVCYCRFLSDFLKWRVSLQNELPTRDFTACCYINIVYFWKIKQTGNIRSFLSNFDDEWIGCKEFWNETLHSLLDLLMDLLFVFLSLVDCQLATNFFFLPKVKKKCFSTNEKLWMVSVISPVKWKQRM